MFSTKTMECADEWSVAHVRLSFSLLVARSILTLFPPSALAIPNKMQPHNLDTSDERMKTSSALPLF